MKRHRHHIQRLSILDEANDAQCGAALLSATFLPLFVWAIVAHFIGG